MSAGLTAGVLISACGNPSRGDDALGPLLLERLSAAEPGAGVELLCDFQFQPEHALDLEGRALVLFVDAHVECSPPFTFQRLIPRRDNSYTTHAMSPWAVMQVYRDIKGEEPPPAFLLSLRGERFELGDDGLSDAAEQHLDAAASLCIRLLENPNIVFWESLAEPVGES